MLNTSGWTSLGITPAPPLQSRVSKRQCFLFYPWERGKMSWAQGCLYLPEGVLFCYSLGKSIEWNPLELYLSLLGWWSDEVGFRRTHCDVYTNSTGLVMQSPAVTSSSLARILLLCFQHQNLLAGTSLVTFWTLKVSKRRLDKTRAPKHWNHWRKNRINLMIQSRQRWFLCEKFLARWLAYFYHRLEDGNLKL